MSNTLYALYKGDEFVDMGTAEELAERRGCKPKSIRFLATKSHKDRTDYRVTIWAYKVEDDE